MLTKNDLQQIRGVVKEEIQKETQPIKSTVTGLQGAVVGLQKDVIILQKDMKYMKKKTNSMNKTLDVAIRMFNREDVRLQKRVTRIENHLQLSRID